MNHRFIFAFECSNRKARSNTSPAPTQAYKPLGGWGASVRRAYVPPEMPPYAHDARLTYMRCTRGVQTETPKPTDGMEYTYARKSVNHDRKDISHIWEVAGSDELCEEVTLSENLFLGMRQVGA